MKKQTLKLIFVIISIPASLSCKKNWLDEKPQQSLIVPSSISDYQALLDDATGVTGLNVNQPGLDEIGAGDFYLTSQEWASRSTRERNAYIWASGDIYGDNTSIADWIRPYEKILKTNIIIEGLDKISPSSNTEQIAWRTAKGSALFFRAYSHYNIAQLFCKPFNSSSANTDLGIPLRLTSNFNTKSVRVSVNETYEQITNDLKQALLILPTAIPNTEISKMRPSKVAAKAMLARVYLSMNNYDSALLYSDKCLQDYSSLMDYSKIPIDKLKSNTPFQSLNEEVMFHMQLMTFASLAASRLIVDSTLFRSFSTDDLRKTAFFRLQSGNYTFKGSYVHILPFFCGLATDEIYLIRAECQARKNNSEQALKDLNTLLAKRWDPQFYTPYTANTPQEALNLILQERRKELCFRGLRWSDLRRLNMDPLYAITLTRTINNQPYYLPPQDARYVLPIPPDVIQLSGIQQNIR